MDGSRLPLPTQSVKIQKSTYNPSLPCHKNKSLFLCFLISIYCCKKRFNKELFLGHKFLLLFGIVVLYCYGVVLQNYNLKKNRKGEVLNNLRGKTFQVFFVLNYCVVVVLWCTISNAVFVNCLVLLLLGGSFVLQKMWKCCFVEMLLCSCVNVWLC